MAKHFLVVETKDGIPNIRSFENENNALACLADIVEEEWNEYQYGIDFEGGKFNLTKLFDHIAELNEAYLNDAYEDAQEIARYRIDYMEL